MSTTPKEKAEILFSIVVAHALLDLGFGAFIYHLGASDGDGIVEYEVGFLVPFKIEDIAGEFAFLLEKLPAARVDFEDEGLGDMGCGQAFNLTVHLHTDGRIRKYDAQAVTARAGFRLELEESLAYVLPGHLDKPELGYLYDAGFGPV